MNINDIAKDMLGKQALKQVSWMVISDINRGDTLRLRNNTDELFAFLEERAVELEAQEALAPQDNLDWLALAFFAQDRDRFKAHCDHMAAIEDRSYARVNYWLSKITNADSNE